MDVILYVAVGIGLTVSYKYWKQYPRDWVRGIVAEELVKLQREKQDEDE